MLRLIGNEASPFVRKVRLAAFVRGVEFEMDRVTVNPVERNGSVGAAGPLAKIPVLLTQHGPLYDSRVICRYIDGLGSGRSLYASEVADGWQILTLEALADGIMDAAVASRYELAFRPEALRWEPWITAQFARISAALDELEAVTGRLAQQHMGALAVAAALAYLDFRHATLSWRDGRPELAGWLSEFARTPAMTATAYR